MCIAQNKNKINKDIHELYKYKNTFSRKLVQFC